MLFSFFSAKKRKTRVRDAAAVDETVKNYTYVMYVYVKYR